ncbi:unnamed protein product [Rhodiola kirilowii]
MGRSPCCEKAHINKGAWTKEEDDRLIAHIQAHGEGCWRSLPKAAGLLRCGNFTEEDQLIIELHSLIGNKWSLIAGRLPGRTDNEIKNYWNTHIRKKLLSKGLILLTIDQHEHLVYVKKVIFSNEIKAEENMIHTEDAKDMDLNLDLRISPPSRDSVQSNLWGTQSAGLFLLQTGIREQQRMQLQWLCNAQ